MLLKLERVGLSFGSQTIFRELDLTLAKGEKIGLTGASGVGKSTLLKIAAALSTPPLSGKVLRQYSRLGYVFQEPRLLPWYTAIKNISLVLEAAGWTSSQSMTSAKQALEQMDLAGFDKYYPGALSGGMKQRVSIARALAVSPDLLLLDEPFTGLDPALRDIVREQMAEAVQRVGSGVIHVTHSMKELLPDTDRVLMVTPQGICEI